MEGVQLKHTIIAVKEIKGFDVPKSLKGIWCALPAVLRSGCWLCPADSCTLGPHCPDASHGRQQLKAPLPGRRKFMETLEGRKSWQNTCAP